MGIKTCLLVLILRIFPISLGFDEIEHSKGDNDFRYISYKDLLPSSDIFTDENVTSFSRLLFDVARDQVIVGARDSLYRLSFRLSLREKASWKAPTTMMTTCQDKGQSEYDCRNYIMVLQSYGNLLYVCGTYAFSPNCSWRQMENLTVISYEKGVAKCPFNPNANVTSLITDSGQIFVGSPTDFSSSDPAILRATITKDANKLLRTNQYNSEWLNDPQFVGSFETGEFVYFIFRETAVEYINCGKVIYSRIARVCKSDPGGEHFLKDNWTSFLKARLNCSLPGEYPFYFDEVKGISYSQDEDILYATFTTSENSIHGSAICAFNLSSINLAFRGPFKHQDTRGSTWKSADSIYRSQYECEFASTTLAAKQNQLFDSSRYQLMDKSVQPITNTPLYHVKLERLVHITVDIIPTKWHSRIHVLYVSTETGDIKKISILPRTRKACIIEIWQPEMHVSTRIRTIQYLKETESLYVGTDTALTRIPAQHCLRHVSKSSCLNSMDPYCGWNELKEVCSPPPNGDTLQSYWIQNSIECPLLKAPVDGGWSAWSDWFKCAQNTEQDIDDINGNFDTCLCKRRNCNNPTAKNGGKSCTGLDIVVSNCTINGGWTEWSAWSACSQTCGVAVKTRRRTCGNPKPAHGGRICVGHDRGELYCPHLPPCPVPEEQPVDGAWGPWGSWSDCSSPCGGGYKSRRRKCNDPEPRNGGLDCSGCHIEYEICNVKSCPEIKRMSSWTPWLTQINGTANGRGRLERRFKFACKSNTSSLKLSLAKEETRICHSDGSCQRSGEGSDDGEWSDWTPCSASCGGGTQFRTKACEDDDCDGRFKIARACNIHPCAEWGCWTDWSSCSVSCGTGSRRRSRICLAVDCDGSNLEEELCEMPPCTLYLGWSKWSKWSECNDNGERYRRRECTINNPQSHECQGDDIETRSCKNRKENEAIYAAGLGASSIFSICCGVTIFFSAISVLLTAVYFKRQNNTKNANYMPSSQCYGSYPNQYDSLPTKEYNEQRAKPKRQSSFNAGNSGLKNNGNGHGTLTKTNNVAGNYTPKVLSKSFSDCETSTLKRNSHGLNNARLHRPVDDEKF